MALDGSLVEEGLDPCRSCNRADMYVVGHHDFSKEIAIREEEERMEDEVPKKAILERLENVKHGRSMENV